MIVAVLFMLCIGLLCGIVLSVASKVFYVYEDPRISDVENFLAGANCGGCGYAGCSAAAAAIVEGKVPPNACILADAEAVANIAAIIGSEAESAEAKHSLNECLGGDRAENRFYYMGINSCKALAALYGGMRVCEIGCLGLGDCIKACSFDAIKMSLEGYPIVDDEKCVGCGACEDVCPKNIISVKTMSERLLHFNQDSDALAPCAQTCPAEINIAKYISQIRNGDFIGAVNTIRERNPLLLSCGRVCPHPCETYCRRGIEDEPVSINQLKRFVADMEMESGRRIPIKCLPPTGKRVAIIGSGPAGLSCAYFLRRLGHEVTIFEAMPKLGGMIRYGIPEYRLPKKVLDWEIEGILKLGIKSHTNVRLGLDFTLGSLISAGYDAIFLGVGAWKDYQLKVEGEELSGCYTGINFLSKVAMGESIPIGRRAVVIGGGNTAIDCCRTLVRMGAEKVYIVYRRTKSEMPANKVEIEAAEHEGVEFLFLAAPVRITGDSQGNVVQLEYLKMELGKLDSSGRRRPVPIKGSETLLEIDMVVIAIGQSPDLSFAKEEKRLKDLSITRWDTIDADDETLQSSIPYIFTAGDSATGPSLVVDAIGGGRRAARSIDQYLNGKPVTPVPNRLFKKHIKESLFEYVEGVKHIPRIKNPELSVEDRVNSFVECDLVISKEEAISESKRCLSCCRICYNKDKNNSVAA